jgi:hypothetical protein
MYRQGNKQMKSRIEVIRKIEIAQSCVEIILEHHLCTSMEMILEHKGFSCLASDWYDGLKTEAVERLISNPKMVKNIWNKRHCKRCQSSSNGLNAWSKDETSMDRVKINGITLPRTMKSVEFGKFVESSSCLEFCKWASGTVVRVGFLMEMSSVPQLPDLITGDIFNTRCRNEFRGREVELSKKGGFEFVKSPGMINHACEDGCNWEVIWVKKQCEEEFPALH